MVRTWGLIGGVLLVLAVATVVVRALRNRADSGLDQAILKTFQLRVRAWWVLFSILAGAILIGQTAIGRVAIVTVFGLISFWALREFITLTPTRPGDHRALFWVFFILTPMQFVLVAQKSYGTWETYGLYSILIPVYGFLFILARTALAGDYKRFLERTAKIQAGMMVCVYCLSHAPALLTFLDLSEDHDAALLLFYFVVIVQFSDAMQYAWAQIPSKHVIAPSINPGKTWEGLLGGTASATLLGTALYWATPFPVWLAALMSAVIAMMGFAGGLTMSAIKRDRGVKDYGTLVEGHGGVLDRIDSICFAAPVFFHFARFTQDWWR